MIIVTLNIGAKKERTPFSLSFLSISTRENEEDPKLCVFFCNSNYSCSFYFCSLHTIPTIFPWGWWLGRPNMQKNTLLRPLQLHPPLKPTQSKTWSQSGGPLHGEQHSGKCNWYTELHRGPHQADPRPWVGASLGLLCRVIYPSYQIHSPTSCWCYKPRPFWLCQLLHFWCSQRSEYLRQEILCHNSSSLGGQKRHCAEACGCSLRYNQTSAKGLISSPLFCLPLLAVVGNSTILAVGSYYSYSVKTFRWLILHNVYASSIHCLCTLKQLFINHTITSPQRKCCATSIWMQLPLDINQNIFFHYFRSFFFHRSRAVTGVNVLC